MLDIDTQNIISIVFAAILAGLPVIFIKQWTMDSTKYSWLIAAACSYFLLIIEYMNILKNNSMSIVYPAVKILSILLVVSAGIIWNQEKLLSRHYVGILFGVCAIYLLS